MKLKRVTVVLLSLVLLFSLASCGLTTTTEGLVCTLNGNRRTYTLKRYEPCGEECKGELCEEGHVVHPTSVVVDYYKKWPVSHIGNDAFKDCTHIEFLELGELVQYVEGGAFSGCTSLQSVTFGKELVKIGVKAFYGCESLVTVELPDGVMEIGNEAFSNCSAMTSITLSEQLIKIGGAAFKGCTDIKEITVPDNVTEIGSEAFSDCKSLTSIVVGANVTKIGPSAFSNCDKLRAVYYAGSLTGKERNALFNQKTGKDNSKRLTTLVYAYSEEAPTESGKFWHYVDGVPTAW